MFYGALGIHIALKSNMTQLKNITLNVCRSSQKIKINIILRICKPLKTLANNIKTKENTANH